MENVRTPLAVAIISARVKDGIVTLSLKGADDQVIEIQLKPEIMPVLTAALIASLGKLGPKPDQDSIAAQPITVIGVRPALSKTRQPMLDLMIEGSGHMAITFPRNAIVPMQTALAELLELSKPRNQGH
jgi:hypothetical protein